MRTMSVYMQYFYFVSHGDTRYPARGKRQEARGARRGLTHAAGAQKNTQVPVPVPVPVTPPQNVAFGRSSSRLSTSF